MALFNDESPRYSVTELGYDNLLFLIRSRTGGTLPGEEKYSFPSDLYDLFSPEEISTIIDIPSFAGKPDGENGYVQFNEKIAPKFAPTFRGSQYFVWDNVNLTLTISNDSSNTLEIGNGPSHLRTNGDLELICTDTEDSGTLRTSFEDCEIGLNFGAVALMITAETDEGSEITLRGYNPSSTVGVGLILAGSDAFASGEPGGHLTLISGSGIGGNAEGAPILLYLGAGTGSGADGTLQISQSGSLGGIVFGGISTLTNVNTVTFQDLTGTLTLQSGALTSTRVPFSNGSGILVDDADFTFATDTLSITKVNITGTSPALAFASGAVINFASGDMLITHSSNDLAITGGTLTVASLIATTADINGGTIDGAVIGGSSPAAITGTAIIGTSLADLGLTQNALLHADGSGVLTSLALGGRNEVVGMNDAGTANEYKKAIVRLSVTTGIDGKVATTTNLYTVPSGRTAIITHAVIRVSAASAITVPPSLGIGVAAGEDDIYTSTSLVGLDTTGEVYVFASEGLQVAVAAASVIKLGIDTGATATTATLEVDLFGYLI